MSIKLMAQVWEYQFNRGEQAVLLAMADHANDDGRCFPSIALLAWKTDYSERQVIRILQQLVKNKVLTVVVQATNRRPTEYAIHLKHAKLKPPMRAARGDTVSPVEVTPRHPTKAARGDISAARGDISAARGDTMMSPEPSLEPSQEPPVVSERAREVPSPAPTPAPAAPSKPSQLRAAPLPPPGKPKSVIVYQNLAHFPPDVVSEQAILAAVGEDEPSLKRWGDAVTAWLLSGHRANNVRGMLDWYHDGIPTYPKENANGQSGRPAGRRPRPPATAPVERPAYDPSLENEFN